MKNHDENMVIVPVSTEIQHVHNDKTNKHYILLIIKDMNGDKYTIGMNKKLATELMDGLGKICDDIKSD